MKNETIKDIAAKAGVSISTVSRVLNNNYPVSSQSRQRVLEAAKLLNYSPNSVARSLRKQETHLIGVIVADLGNEFFMHMVKGIESAVAALGYCIIIASSDGDIAKERRLLAMMLEQRVSSLILTPFDSETTRLEEFRNVGIPVVLADRYIDGYRCDSVVSDNQEVAQSLTNLLIEAGHINIGIVNVQLSITSGRDRYQGFCRALTDGNLLLNTAWVSESCFDQNDAYLWIKSVFCTSGAPTALLCANNITAVGALRAFQELGLSIPNDVSLVVIGDLPMQEFISPKVTSSTQRGFDIGKASGVMAVERIKNGSLHQVKQLVIPSIITCRQSVR